MADLNRYRVVWTGGPGGEGVSTFYGPTDSFTALADLHTFYTAIDDLFTPQITWSFPNAGDIITDTSGAIVGTWTQDPETPVPAGVGSPAFAAGVGVRVRWITDGIDDGRRVVGSTFLTSLVSSAYQTDGTILNSTVTTIQNASDFLVAQGWMRIFSRRPGGAGFSSDVVSAVVVDKVSWLRSRRQ